MVLLTAAYVSAYWEMRFGRVIELSFNGGMGSWPPLSLRMIDVFPAEGMLTTPTAIVGGVHNCEIVAPIVMFRAKGNI